MKKFVIEIDLEALEGSPPAVLGALRAVAEGLTSTVGPDDDLRDAKEGAPFGGSLALPANPGADTARFAVIEGDLSSFGEYPVRSIKRPNEDWEDVHLH